MRIHRQIEGGSENQTFKQMDTSFLERAHFEVLVLKENNCTEL